MLDRKFIEILDDVTADKIFNEVLKKLDAKNFHKDTRLKNLRELAVKNAELAVELIKGGCA